MTTAEVDVGELYVEAVANFGRMVDAVAEHEWDLPTPCSDWNVKEIVAHVVLGEAQLPAVLSGESSATQASLGVELLGASPIATWRGTAIKAIEATRVPGVVEQVFDLNGGSVSGEQLLAYRITDNLVHAWDISVAVGRIAAISDPHAEWLLAFWQPVAMQIQDANFFAPPIEPPAGASASDRLLALLGRHLPGNDT